MAARILLIGATGRLGRAVHKLIPDAYAPTRAEMDVTSPRSVSIYIGTRREPVFTVINCAGYSDALAAESNRRECWKLNVSAVQQLAYNLPRFRLVHISSDYVFDGATGNYEESEPPSPVNFYGVTKAVAEVALEFHERSLIIRAPFRPDPPWRYAKAFTDQWTSCRFVSQVAPDIVRAALMPELTGIIHIGGPRRSVYDLAREASPEVGQLTRADFPGLRLPRDTSLDSSKWHSILAASTPSSQLAAIST